MGPRAENRCLKPSGGLACRACTDEPGGEQRAIGSAAEGQAVAAAALGLARQVGPAAEVNADARREGRETPLAWTFTHRQSQSQSQTARLASCWGALRRLGELMRA